MISVDRLFSQEIVAELQLYMLALMFGSMRFLPILIVFPPFYMASLSAGILRGGIMIGVSLYYFPLSLTALQTLQSGELGYEALVWLFPKEIFVGLLIGLILSLPFWITFMSGALVDTQAGDAFGGLLDPTSGEETTPTATFYQLIMLAVFLQLGLLVVMVTRLIPASFDIWPLLAAMPERYSEIYAFMIELLGYMFVSSMLIVLPFLVGLFMVDLGFALLSRFVPSLNPFFLSMSAKTIFVALFGVLYHQFLVTYMAELMELYNLIGTG